MEEEGTNALPTKERANLSIIIILKWLFFGRYKLYLCMCDHWVHILVIHNIDIPLD